VTIRKGEEWGVAVERPADLHVCVDDADLAEHVAAGAIDPLAVAAGDLARTVGSPGPRAALQRVPVDLLRVVADGRTLVAVAHVVARTRWWWPGPIVGAFNSEYLGEWDVAPRAHPNDGIADVVEVDAAMPLRARLQARRRLPSGTHVPHPCVTSTRRAEVEWRFERPLQLHVDGRRRGDVRELRVTVQPDAFYLHV
jgi:YegS C-terminal NAD kinase beta sandwich-like domain